MLLQLRHPSRRIVDAKLPLCIQHPRSLDAPFYRNLDMFQRVP